MWLHGQAVKTSPSQGGITGSNPVGVTIFFWKSEKDYGGNYEKENQENSISFLCHDYMFNLRRTNCFC